MRGGGGAGAARARALAPAVTAAIVPHTFGVETILPTQVGRSPAAARGLTALYAAILERALDDAGLLRTHGAPSRPATPYTKALARRTQQRRASALAWLLGTRKRGDHLPEAMTATGKGRCKW
jgi:hypothetical protein